MTDYKQKVIEAIQGWMLDDGGSEYDLCNRLAPFIRQEFPEEKFKNLLLDREVWSTRGLLLQCKRIWDEQEAPSTNDLEGGLWVLATAPSDTAHVHFSPVVDTTPKGTCTGIEDLPAKASNAGEWQPDRRSGKERRVMEYRRTGGTGRRAGEECTKGVLYSVVERLKDRRLIAEAGKKGTWNPPADETIEYIGPPKYESKRTCQTCGGSKKVPGETLMDWARDPINRPTKEIPCPECASPEGTCPTCGGSGKVTDDKGRLCTCEPIPVISKYQDEEDTCSRCDKPIEWCPDCDGTGECQHKNATRHEKPMPLPFCPDCVHYFDPRSGKERRVKRSPRMTVHDLSGSWFMSKETTSLKLILYPDLRDGKDRRK